MQSQHAPMKCPGCGAELTGSTSVFSEARPKPGDFTVCMYCANVLRYREGDVLARLNADDEKELKKDPKLAYQLLKTQRTVAYFKAARG